MSDTKNTTETNNTNATQQNQSVWDKASDALAGDNKMIANLLKMLFNPAVLITAIIVGFMFFKHRNKQKEEVKNNEENDENKKYKKLKRKYAELQNELQHDTKIRRRLYERIRSMNEDAMLNKQSRSYKQSQLNGTLKSNKTSTAILD